MAGYCSAASGFPRRRISSGWRLPIYKEIYSEYGDLPREGVAGKIYTSTPYPEDKTILYHNESSHMNAWPTRISFFCVIAAKEGGCSPVVDCRKVYQGPGSGGAREIRRNWD